MTEPQNTGSYAETAKGGGSLLWLWLLLGLVALALAIWAIVAALDDDDDDDDEAALPVATQEATATEDPTVASEPVATDDAIATSEVAEADTAEVTQTQAPATDEETATAEPAPAVAGAVLVGDVDILTDDTGVLELVGQPVEAESVQVRELAADEAFFVGPEAGRTVLVRLPAFAGEDDPESPFSIEEGDTVSFTGTLEKINEALLSELQLYSPAENLELGDVYVKVEEISGVR